MKLSLTSEETSYRLPLDSQHHADSYPSGEDSSGVEGLSDLAGLIRGVQSLHSLSDGPYYCSSGAMNMGGCSWGRQGLLP